MKVVIFIPGYLTAQTCSSVGDTYVEIARFLGHDSTVEMQYVPIPNNNYGDIGNTTMESNLAHVIREYNQICDRVPEETTITLAGHSMGGLLVAKMVSITSITQLQRRPDFVWMMNPALQAQLSVPERLFATVLSFLPTTVQGVLCLPISVADPGGAAPNSPATAPLCKQRLGVSMLRVTNQLFVNNTRWDLTPPVDIREHVCVVACRGDAMTMFEAARSYANTHSLQFVPVDNNFHAFFDDASLNSLHLHSVHP